MNKIHNLWVADKMEQINCNIGNFYNICIGNRNNDKLGGITSSAKTRRICQPYPL